MANGASIKDLQDAGKVITAPVDNDILFVGNSKNVVGDGSPELSVVKIKNLVLNNANVAGRLYLHANSV